MTPGVCELPDCTKTARSSKTTVCEMHYYRMRRTGTYDQRPELQKRPRHEIPCSINDCERRSERIVDGARVCGPHAKRRERHGRFHRVKQSAAPRPTRAVCTVDDCGQLDDGPHGLCKRHKTRLDRHGDALTVIQPSDRAVKRLEEHPAWTGDAASYEAAHQRVKARHGSASLHVCVDCGGQAAHWSYDHADPNERRSEKGPYSPDIDHYDPRCVSCHKRFDMAHLRATA